MPSLFTDSKFDDNLQAYALLSLRRFYTLMQLAYLHVAAVSIAD